MAFSKSKQGAQVAISCKCCETLTSKVEWKCLNCDLLMCSSCKNKIHPKFKLADRHQVVQYKDYAYRQPLRLKFLETTEYLTNLQDISFILSAEKNSLWICDDIECKKTLGIFRSSKNLQKVLLDGNVLKLVCDVKYEDKIGDLALLASGSLVLFDSGDSRLKQITKDTNQVTDTQLSVKPYYLRAVHVTPDSQIIVGVTNRDEDMFLVIVMNEEGDHLDVYKQDKNGTALFNNIIIIRTTTNGYILVVNKNDVGSGNMVALNRKGGVVFIYDGFPLYGNEKHEFNPRGLAVTQSNNILIADSMAEELHYISNTGKPLKRFDTLTLGISDPHALAVCSVGETCVLYIGCDSDKGSKWAKLYRVTFTEY